MPSSEIATAVHARSEIAPVWPPVVVARGQLLARGLVVEGNGAGLALTEPGRTTADRLQAAHCECLRRLLADWPAGDEPELQPVLTRLARELSTSPRS